MAAIIFYPGTGQILKNLKLKLLIKVNLAADFRRHFPNLVQSH